jgi:hypothetical protein
LFAPFKRCDLHGLGEADARARLKSYLAPAEKPTHTPFPPSIPRAGATAPFPGKAALSNIPIRVPRLFMGHDNGDGLDEAVVALRTFALFERQSIADERDLSITNDTIRLHRLVREIAVAGA